MSTAAVHQRVVGTNELGLNNRRDGHCRRSSHVSAQIHTLRGGKFAILSRAVTQVKMTESDVEARSMQPARASTSKVASKANLEGVRGRRVVAVVARNDKGFWAVHFQGSERCSSLDEAKRSVERKAATTIAWRELFPGMWTGSVHAPLWPQAWQ
jgi:hypothetical protein